MDLRYLAQAVATGTAVVIMNSLLMFLWFVYHFMTKSPIQDMVLVSCLLALTAWSYNRTAFSDPGSAKCDEWKEWAAGVAELGLKEAGKSSSGKKGQWATGEATRCNKCKCLRPERAHHCRRCGVCVLRMDHHCPIIGNCIGWRNHKYFVLTAFWGFWACFAGIGTSREPSFAEMTAIIREGSGHYAPDQMHVRIYTLAVIVSCSLMIFCLGLFVQDVFMGLLNTNRIEMWHTGSNPYRLPNLLDNLRQTFGNFSPRLLLPIEPDRPTSDGTRFPLGAKAAMPYNGLDQLYAAGWLHVE